MSVTLRTFFIKESSKTMSTSVSSKLAKVGVAAVLGLGLTIGGGVAANAAPVTTSAASVGQFTVTQKGLGNKATATPAGNVGKFTVSYKGLTRNR